MQLLIPHLWVLCNPWLLDYTARNLSVPYGAKEDFPHCQALCNPLWHYAACLLFYMILWVIGTMDTSSLLGYYVIPYTLNSPLFGIIQ
jgi:hypothetical protein